MGRNLVLAIMARWNFERQKMSLDKDDRCGIGWLSTTKRDWLTPVCKLHDQMFIENYSFADTTRRFYTYAFNRAEMLGKSKLKAAAYVAIGTIIGAPIWASRKLWRIINAQIKL